MRLRCPRGHLGVAQRRAAVTMARRSFNSGVGSVALRISSSGSLGFQRPTPCMMSPTFLAWRRSKAVVSDV
eukprot:9305926-Alexandrium_andersonii.AAC.1